MKLDLGSVCFFWGGASDFFLLCVFCLYVFLCVYVFVVHVYLRRMNKPGPLKMRLYLGCLCGWVRGCKRASAREEERERVGGAKYSHIHQIHSLYYAKP
jgi:hypothetical protein